jgi:hypothetical protein
MGNKYCRDVPWNVPTSGIRTVGLFEENGITLFIRIFAINKNFTFTQTSEFSLWQILLKRNTVEKKYL